MGRCLFNYAKLKAYVLSKTWCKTFAACASFQPGSNLFHIMQHEAESLGFYQGSCFSSRLQMQTNSQDLLSPLNVNAKLPGRQYAFEY